MEGLSMVRTVVHKGGVSARLLPLVIWPHSGYLTLHGGSSPMGSQATHVATHYVGA